MYWQSLCYRLSAGALPINSYVKPNPNAMACEGGAFGVITSCSEVLRITALIKEIWRIPLPLQTMWGHSRKTAVYKPGSKPHQTPICQHLNLGLPNLPNGEKQIYVVKSPGYMVFCYSSSNRWGQSSGTPSSPDQCDSVGWRVIPCTQRLKVQFQIRAHT